jgi:hypothetical protein
MDVMTLRFEVEGFDGGIESSRVGDRIEISYQGMAVMSFDVANLTARDWAIASLLDTRLKGKTIAALCHTSAAQVSGVRKLVREGGHEALIHGKTGRHRKLTGSRLVRARKMREQGESVRAIGAALGVSPCTAARAVRDVVRVEEQQSSLPEVGSAPESDEASSHAAHALGETPQSAREVLENESTSSPRAPAGEPGEVSLDERKAAHTGSNESGELQPGEPLATGPAEHPCRYAGTLLIGAAVQALGMYRALFDANVRRPKKSVYKAYQAVVALVTAWASGFGSLEAMHERDARALGVVLGLERSPSVRTLHRAIAQMLEGFDPITFGASLLRGLIAAFGKVPRVFGIDGHFKAYSGKEPIDKGWDTKRRLVQRGLADVLVHDDQGRIWSGFEVGAGDGLHQHVCSAARQLRKEVGEDQSVVMAFDRGGFCFDVLNALDSEGFGYVAWVPSSVTLPDLSVIAPLDEGVGEQLWAHPKLSSEHKARLLVQRDGDALLPAVTNLSGEMSATEAVSMLRRVRGWQENDIKAARSFAHIDRLVDRGRPRRGTDDRLVDNPIRVELRQQCQHVRDRLGELERCRLSSPQESAERAGQELLATFEQAVLKHRLSNTPAKVARFELEPDAQRAWLKTSNRALLQPLKYLLANGRRWLLSALGNTLAPSDASCDSTAVGRTLAALIRAPGTVRFGRTVVTVTLELPLPPQPHERLARGLEELDELGLRFSDGRRPVIFRLAPRPTRDALP